MKDYEETKNFLLKNISRIEELLPSYCKIEETLNNTFTELEKDEIPENINEILAPFEDYTRGLVEVLISKKLTDADKEIIENMSLLISNLNDNFNFFKDRMFIDVLSLLVTTNRTMDETLYLLIFLYEKLSALFYKEDSQSQRVSGKYYSELMNFLSKKNHDSDYSTK